MIASAPAAENFLDDPPLPLADHLIELRRRLIVGLIALGAGTLLAYGWSGAFLAELARPVGELVFLAPTEAFMTRVKVSIFGGFLLTLPVILHQVWLFSARALSRPARRILANLLPLSYLLFLAGAALAFFVVVPAAMRFLLAYGSEAVVPLLSLTAYLGFVIQLCLAFGLVFQVPLALYGLNRTGVLPRQTLISRRRYIYLLAFFAAALLSPGPDVFSQVAMAVPFVVLFELTLLAM